MGCQLGKMHRQRGRITAGQQCFPPLFPRGPLDWAVSIRLKSLRKVETFDKMCLHEATWTPPLGGGGGLSEIRDLRDFSDKTRDLSFLDEICLILFDSVLF